MNGTRGRGRPSSDPNEIIPRYPGRALGSFEAAQAALDRLSESLVAWKMRWASDLQVVAQSAGMRALVSQADDLQARVASQSAEIAGLRSRAQESQFNAEKSRRDAEAAYAAAEKDFAASAKAAKTAARQYLDNARTAAGNTANALFNASLALEENAQARTRFEKDIPALLARIEQARFQQDVKEVDALIDEAIERFRKERFLDARLSLDRARELWNQMPEGRKGPYDLLEGWYARVLAALAVSGDRVLVANDPRLDVISPLMSRAGELVAEAERLAADAERLRSANARDTRINELLTRKTELLSQAGTHVASVLSVAGGYAEAKVLQLRIRKLADPGGFQRTAREAVTKAIGSGLARDATNVAQKDALNELTDYEKVVEDRALRVTINDALKQLQEKVYGWKLPSTEEIAQAAALVAEAQRRFKPADPATYEEALTRLNAAIAITGRALPDQTTARTVNRSARDLRERILNLRQAATITVTTPQPQGPGNLRHGAGAAQLGRGAERAAQLGPHPAPAPEVSRLPAAQQDAGCFESEAAPVRLFRACACALLFLLACMPLAGQTQYWENPVELVSGARIRHSSSAAGNGLMAVAWQEIAPRGRGGLEGKITLSLSTTSDGRTWTKPNRSFFPEITYKMQEGGVEPRVYSMTVDPRGRILVAVARSERGITVLQSEDAGRTFQPAAVLEPGEVLVAPGIFTSANGGIHHSCLPRFKPRWRRACHARREQLS